MGLLDGFPGNQWNLNFPPATCFYAGLIIRTTNRSIHSILFLNHYCSWRSIRKQHKYMTVMTRYSLWRKPFFWFCLHNLVSVLYNRVRKTVLYKGNRGRIRTPYTRILVIGLLLSSANLLNATSIRIFPQAGTRSKLENYLLDWRFVRELEAVLSRKLHTRPF